MWAELTAAHLDKPSELMALTEQLTVHEKDREKEAEMQREGKEEEQQRERGERNRCDYDDK